jgi:hypothetical protein
VLLAEKDKRQKKAVKMLNTTSDISERRNSSIRPQRRKSFFKKVSMGRSAFAKPSASKTNQVMPINSQSGLHSPVPSPLRPSEQTEEAAKTDDKVQALDSSANSKEPAKEPAAGDKPGDDTHVVEELDDAPEPLQDLEEIDMNSDEDL